MLGDEGPQLDMALKLLAMLEWPLLQPTVANRTKDDKCSATGLLHKDNERTNERTTRGTTKSERARHIQERPTSATESAGCDLQNG